MPEIAHSCNLQHNLAIIRQPKGFPKSVTCEAEKDTEKTQHAEHAGSWDPPTPQNSPLSDPRN